MGVIHLALNLTLSRLKLPFPAWRWGLNLVLFNLSPICHHLLVGKGPYHLCFCGSGGKQLLLLGLCVPSPWWPGKPHRSSTPQLWLCHLRGPRLAEQWPLPIPLGRARAGHRPSLHPQLWTTLPPRLSLPDEWRGSAGHQLGLCGLALNSYFKGGSWLCGQTPDSHPRPGYPQNRHGGQYPPTPHLLGPFICGSQVWLATC